MPPKPGQSAVVENSTTENGQVTDTNATATKAKAPKTTHMVPVTIPNALYDIIAKQAEEGKVSVAYIARKALADTVGYTLSPFTRARTRKYGSKEEAKAAQKDRYQRAQLLLAALEAGEIDQSILDKMRAQQEAAKAAAAQPAVAVTA